MFLVKWITDASEGLTLESIRCLFLSDHRQAPLVIAVRKMEEEIEHEVGIRFSQNGFEARPWSMQSVFVHKAACVSINQMESGYAERA